MLRSLADLDGRLDDGDEHDVFVFDGANAQVVLENDCRRYPLRLRATWDGDAAASLDAFERWCTESFDVSFDASLPGAVRTRLPGLAVKVGIYHALDTIKVHFYKSSDRRARRSVIARIVRLS